MSTLTPVCLHNEERIDGLIVDAIRNGSDTFDSIFLHVSRNYYMSNTPGFFFVVESRFKSLKRRSLISYDRQAKTWITAL